MITILLSRLNLRQIYNENGLIQEARSGISARGTHIYYNVPEINHNFRQDKLRKPILDNFVKNIHTYPECYEKTLCAGAAAYA